MGGLMEERGRWKFSLRDVLVAMIAVGVCFALLARWIHVTREESRRNTCINNLKLIGVGLHNHHDVFRKFPALTSTQLYGTAPGSVGIMSPASGFSWCVRILPYFEETVMYNNISQRSNKFQIPPFSVPSAFGPGGRPLWSVDVATYSCPSYSGPPFAAVKEYVAHSGTDATGKPFGVAASNYVALTATHLTCITNDPDATGAIKYNGVIVPGRGTNLRDIVDGTYCTLMVCESRESGYSSWYDGTVGWVVAADPNGPEPTKDSNDYWTTSSGSSIQLGPRRSTPKRIYLPAAKLSTIQSDRQWGPSSEHASGVVNHLDGDASVHCLKDDIDPTVYLQITTRAGREPTTVPYNASSQP
jgi:hypothetical protein